MSTNTIRDLYKYKQYPYFEPNTKKERISMQRVLRHYAKITMAIEALSNSKYKYTKGILKVSYVPN